MLLPKVTCLCNHKRTLLHTAAYHSRLTIHLNQYVAHKAQGDQTEFEVSTFPRRQTSPKAQIHEGCGPLSQAQSWPGK